MRYIKNPNILADKIVEIYNNNPNAKVKLQYVVNKLIEMKTLMSNIKNL